MHDMCHTANRVARLMAELLEEKAKGYHGDDEWEALDPCQKVVHELYDAFLDRELGEAIREAWQASGGRVRLECSGVCFLRSICKLTHRSWACPICERRF
jgi:hypothetical protein